jgi:recombination associated protein RdgC
MPVLRGALTFARFHAEPIGERPKDQKRWLARGLRDRAFKPLDRSSEEDRSAGWVELEQNDSTELAPSSFLYGEYVLVSYRIDKLRVPASALKAELEAWAREYTKAKGRPPKKPERAEHREMVHKKLRARALPQSRVFDVSWSQKSDQIQIWASARSVVEEIKECLESVFELELTAQTPSAFAAAYAPKQGAIEPTADLIARAE